jgi:hypothetical protein
MDSKHVRTSKGLVEALFDELDALKEGKSTPQNARAKASLANTICQVTRLEMEYARFVTDARAAKDQVAGAPALPALEMGLRVAA